MILIYFAPPGEIKVSEGLRVGVRGSSAEARAQGEQRRGRGEERNREGLIERRAGGPSLFRPSWQAGISQAGRLGSW